MSATSPTAQSGSPCPSARLRTRHDLSRTAHAELRARNRDLNGVPPATADAPPMIEPPHLSRRADAIQTMWTCAPAKPEKNCRMDIRNHPTACGNVRAHAERCALRRFGYCTCRGPFDTTNRTAPLPHAPPKRRQEYHCQPARSADLPAARPLPLSAVELPPCLRRRQSDPLQAAAGRPFPRRLSQPAAIANGRR